MKVAVLSGKGGAGKTFVAVNLAAVTRGAAYLDCDVEEPNGHLFLRPTLAGSRDVFEVVPRIDDDACTGCRVCVDFCRFNALAAVGARVLVFEDLCHSCGGCHVLCPEHAVIPTLRRVGRVRWGAADDVAFASGALVPGAMSASPVVHAVLERGQFADDAWTFMDCAPGTACTVMDVVADADVCLVVAEPTLFGAHDFAMVADLIRVLGKPAGIVVNKWTGGETAVDRLAAAHQLPVLARIPYDADLHRLIAAGRVASQESEPHRQRFESLAAGLSTLAAEAVPA